MMNYDTTVFVRDLKELDISLTCVQIEQFMNYYEMLVEKNKVMNLTAITEYDEVLKKHFVDSLSLIKAFDVRKRVSLIDVGTGAGFPGLALKIAFPDLEVTLLDSLKKRLVFLDEVITCLQLTGVKTVHGRAEDAAKNETFREKYDVCVSRAVANLSTLSELCIPFVKIGGCFISYKSEKVAEELNTAAKAIALLGGKVEKQEEFNLPSSDIYRNLFVIRKYKNTPVKFPRKAGLPAKEPLE